MKESHQGTILIVDDDAGMRGLLEVLLENAGYHPISAHDARSAKSLLCQYRDSLRACLLDLNLDDCQGEDLYDELVSICPNLAVFPMSGLYGDEIEERFSGRAIAGVIPKPFLSRQLMETLDQGLQRSGR